jgi:hypothetical protein
VAWSLQKRDEPFPYAQFTVVRTAITAASTALWMLSGSNADERRIRGLWAASSPRMTLRLILPAIRKANARAAA